MKDQKPEPARAARKLNAIVIGTLLFLALPVVSLAQSRVASDPPRRSITDFHARSIGPEVHASWDDRNGRARFVMGRFETGLSESEGLSDPTTAARKIAARFGRAFGLDKVVNEVRVRHAYPDQLGFVHIVLEQDHRGIPVVGSELRIHLRGSALSAINGAIAESVDLPTLRPKINRGQASAIASRLHPDSTISSGPRLVIMSREVDSSLDGDHLAWQVTTVRESDNSSFDFFLDAMTGVPIRKVSNTHSAINRRIYDLQNTGIWPSAPYATESSPPPASDIDGDHAYDMSNIVYNHFVGNYGWRSYNNLDSPLDIGIRLSRVSVGGDNAFWNDNLKALLFTPGMVALDVMGHEFTHGVIHSMGGKLDYYGQPGALNESYADIFGVIIDSDDWAIAENAVSGVLRSMAFPYLFTYTENNGTTRPYPYHASDYRCYTVFDYGGVHVNSNIHNYAAYLIMSDIGRHNGGRIFFRALRDYLGVFSDFADARDAATAAATDLFGLSSAQRAAVVSAFTQIGLPPGYSIVTRK